MYGSGGVIGTHSLALTAEPTIVIGRKGSIGAIFRSNGPSWTMDTAYFTRHDASALSLDWLQLALSAANLASLNKASGVPGLNRDDVYRVSIRLPPIEQQHQLVHALFEVRDAARSLRAHVEEQLQEAAKLLVGGVALLIGPGVKLPNDRVDAPHGWSWRALTEVAQLESGHTPSRKRADWWGGDVPWLALPDIRRAHGQVIDDTLEHTNPDGLANSSARLLPAGTVCLSRTASVGFSTMLSRPMATSQDFVNWVCGPELDPAFLLAALVNSGDYLRSIAEGAIHKTIYVPAAKALQICMPPIALQRAAVAALDERRASLTAVSTALQRQLAEADALDAALLRAAFSGQL